MDVSSQSRTVRLSSGSCRTSMPRAGGAGPKNQERPSINIRRLDGSALRQILGVEYARIRGFQSTHSSQGPSPVPIESLDHLPKLKDLPKRRQLPAWMAPTASPGSAHRLGSVRRPNVQGRHHSSNSPIPSSYSTSQAAPAPYASAPTPRNPKKANHGRDGLLTPATPSPTYPSAATDTNVQAMSRAWNSMRFKELKSYWSGTEGAQERMHPTLVSASNYRPRSTPKAPAPRTPSSAQPTALQGSPRSLLGSRATSGSASRGPRPSVSVSAPRATAASMQPSSPSPRVFGPISSARLNAVPTPPSHSRGKTNVVRIKTEIGPPAASSRGAKNRPFEVIDLTGDD